MVHLERRPSCLGGGDAAGGRPKTLFAQVWLLLLLISLSNKETERDCERERVRKRELLRASEAPIPSHLFHLVLARSRVLSFSPPLDPLFFSLLSCTLSSPPSSSPVPNFPHCATSSPIPHYARIESPTNKALFTSFWLNSNAEISLIKFCTYARTKHTNRHQTCKNVYETCTYVFQLNFHVAYHHWWSGLRFIYFLILRKEGSKAGVFNTTHALDTHTYVYISRGFCIKVVLYYITYNTSLQRTIKV